MKLEVNCPRGCQSEGEAVRRVVMREMEGDSTGRRRAAVAMTTAIGVEGEVMGSGAGTARWLAYCPS